MSEPQNMSGLMDQIHELKTQLADAERVTAEAVMGGQRYAVVWALREAAKDWRKNGLMWDDPDEETNTDLRVARSLDERADRIERGEQS